eukprot:augustus_masked-scaffold_55-processed-gene-1.51-mRNA-1 protein AED:1.00 eAED:1.00 QI:0/-1/0/0/-1/1/1/0/232
MDYIPPNPGNEAQYLVYQDSLGRPIPQTPPLPNIHRKRPLEHIQVIPPNHHGLERSEKRPKGTRAARSETHKYFSKDPENENIRFCNGCNKTIRATKGNTSGMLAHMKACEQICNMEETLEQEKLRSYSITQKRGFEVFKGKAGKEADKEIYAKQLVAIHKWNLPLGFFQKKEIVDILRVVHPNHKPRSARATKANLEKFKQTPQGQLPRRKRSRKKSLDTVAEPVYGAHET